MNVFQFLESLHSWMPFPEDALLAFVKSVFGLARNVALKPVTRHGLLASLAIVLRGSRREATLDYEMVLRAAVDMLEVESMSF